MKNNYPYTNSKCGKRGLVAGRGARSTWGPGELRRHCAWPHTPGPRPAPPAPPLVQPGGRSLRRGHLGHHLIKFNHQNLVTAILYGLTTPLCTNKPPPPVAPHHHPPLLTPSQMSLVICRMFSEGSAIVVSGFVFVAASRTRLT